jgi:hypothetical protein
VIHSLYVFEGGQSVCTVLRNGLTKVWDTLSGELLYETLLTMTGCVLHTVLPTASFENDDAYDLDTLIYVSDKKIQVWQPSLRRASTSTIRQEGDQQGSEMEPENQNQNQNQSESERVGCPSDGEDIFDIEEDPVFARSVRCMYRMEDYVYFGTFAGEIFQRSVSYLYENARVGEIAPLQSGETNSTPISVLHHARSLGLLVGNASGQFIYEDGEEETSLYLPHRHVTIALEDCLRHIFPLAHARDWLCTTGYTVNSHSYYSRDKVFHPCLVWDMSPILRYPGLAGSEVCGAQHVLLGHYEEDEHYDSCLQTVSSLTSGVLAALNRAGRVLLWDLRDNVKTDSDDDDDDEDDDGEEEDDEEDDQD